jgi:2-keto-4-pentenoate hydratase/2-oxohepta-3-ene-1,7-dioic acid hydratase in catechol pathway
MRLMSYRLDGQPHYGAVVGEEVVDLSECIGAQFPSLQALLQAGAWSQAAEATSKGHTRHALAEVEFLAPIPDARRIFCIGRNYPKKYPLGGIVDNPEYPSIFSKAAEVLVPHKGTIRLPKGLGLEFEGELAFVIGRAGQNISMEDALSHVAGYCCLNDGSVREYQKQSLWAGKNFFQSGSWGPWIMTADEIPDPAALTLMTRLNGEEVQRASIDQMFFSVPFIIHYISRVIPLMPGDVITTGSPERSGSEGPLRAGDQLEFEISTIGTLVNEVA